MCANTYLCTYARLMHPDTCLCACVCMHVHLMLRERYTFTPHHHHTQQSHSGLSHTPVTSKHLQKDFSMIGAALTGSQDTLEHDNHAITLRASPSSTYFDHCQGNGTQKVRGKFDSLSRSVYLRVPQRRMRRQEQRHEALLCQHALQCGGCNVVVLGNVLPGNLTTEEADQGLYESVGRRFFGFVFAVKFFGEAERGARPHAEGERAHLCFVCVHVCVCGCAY
jgi:hypothetical protein